MRSAQKPDKEVKLEPEASATWHWENSTIPPASFSSESDSSDVNHEDAAAADTCYEPESDQGKPHLLSQSNLDGLMRDMSLS